MTSQKDDARAEVSGEAPGAAAQPSPKSTTTQDLLRDDHLRELTEGSGIPLDLILERVYRTIETRRTLDEEGFSPSQQRVIYSREGKHAIGMPIHWPGRDPVLGVIKPDAPRIQAKNQKPRKYEVRAGLGMVLDSPPRCHADLNNPNVPLYITEGIKKVDAGAARGGCWIGLLGVYGWRGTNEHGGKVALPELEDVALNGRRVYLIFDSDIMEKQNVHQALGRLKQLLESRGADVRVVYLPGGENGEKVGVDDYFVAHPDATLDSLHALAEKNLRRLPREITEHQSILEVLPDAPASEELVVPLGWQLNSKGIWRIDDRTDRDGEITERRIKVADEPVIVAGRQEYEGDDGAESLVLYHKRYGRWRRRIVDRGVALDARKLVHLSNKGFPVSSGSAGDLVKYILDSETANMSHLPVETVSTKLGFHEPNGEIGFLWGEPYLTTDNTDADTDAHPHEWRTNRVSFRPPDPGGLQLARGFHASGTYEGWLDAVRVVTGFPIVALGFYASFVPPLMHIMKISNFILDFAYGTSTGKTTLMRVAASVWGCADESQVHTVLHTWDTTRTWRERAAATLNHLPFFLDDTKKAKSREDVSQTIYDIASGRGRGRGTVTGTAETSSWQTVLFSTGEAPATSFGEHGGAHARALSTHSLVWGASDERTGRMVNKLKAGLVLNYGHAGPRFVQWLIRNRNRWDEFRNIYAASHERYIKRAGDRAVAVRMAEYFAAIDTAAQLVHEALDLPWAYSDPVHNLYDALTQEASVADRAESALRLALEHAASNQQSFYGRHVLDHEDNPRQPPAGWLGHWPDGDDFSHVGFIETKLHEILRRHGHEDPHALIRLWRDKGWLRMTKEKSGIQRHLRARIDGANTYVVAINGEVARQILGGGDA